MKGADVVMAGIVQYNDWLEEEVSATWDAETGPVSGARPLCATGRWVPVCVFCGRVTGRPVGTSGTAQPGPPLRSRAGVSSEGSAGAGPASELT